MMKPTPEVTLSSTDFFKPSLAGTMAVRNRGAISLTSTAISLYALVGAMAVIDGFEPFNLADYEARGACGGGANDVDTHLCTLDAWALERSRKATLGPPLGPQALINAQSRYRLLARTTLLAGLVADGLRWRGSTSYASELLLGWHSPRSEQWRLAAFLVLAIPLVHLAVLYATPIEVDFLGSDVDPGPGACCAFGPRGTVLEGGPWWDRTNKLFFLLFVTGMSLFGDSHHHGYFLLRVSDAERSAYVLLRQALGKQANRDPARSGSK